MITKSTFYLMQTVDAVGDVFVMDVFVMVMPLDNEHLF